ncbi:MAG: tetratricopeptide repeat protein, partial [Abitibacteriaceae bacterium]|nr:tetratricopeptide repeat protein [Abditibacteriaceae bacterium]
TVGDAFCAAFATALEALNATLEAQNCLAVESWGEVGPLRVRAALHTGEAEARNEDYFGPPLNRVARLLAIGYGGQTLLSLPTQELIRDALPSHTQLRDLGHHRLKDLIRPERVYQVVQPGLATDFPPLKSLDNLPNNLPLQLTSFVGREHDISKVKDLLKGSRVITLTGFGGTGKTRLSLQVAADLLEEYPDGVWLVELAPLTEPNLVPQTVASVLGVREVPGQSLQQTLTEYLKSRTTLLILDNCEHLIEASARLADNLLRSCPHLHIIATSRERLGINESIYPVPPLSLPQVKGGSAPAHTSETLKQYEAVRLFIERAIAVRPDFAITNENAPAVAQVCHRLDGIPLAIELAAARIKLLSVEQINQRLEDRFRLLTGGNRTAMLRHQTLRALIEWSYDLLSETEQVVLRRVSVFRGEFSLEAAEHVGASDDIEAWEVLELLGQLMDKSLIVGEEQADGVYYQQLESIRQYGWERLQESGEVEPVRQRHLEFFLQLAEEALPQLSGPEQATWLAKLQREHDNLRAAFDWSQVASDNALDGLRLAGALWRFWQIQGDITEGRARLEGALAKPKAQLEPIKDETHITDVAWGKAWAQVLNGAGNLAGSQGDYQMAQARLEESLRLRRALGDKRTIAQTLNNLGIVAWNQGERERAKELYEQSLALKQELGDQWGSAQSLNNLAVLSLQQDDPETASGLLEQCLQIRRDLGDKMGIASTLTNLGILTREQGNYQKATEFLQQALALFSELGDKQCIVSSLEAYASLALKRGKPEQAAYLYGASHRLRQDIGAPLPATERADYEGDIATIKSALGETFGVVWQQGGAIPPEQVVRSIIDASEVLTASEVANTNEATSPTDLNERM